MNELKAAYEKAIAELALHTTASFYSESLDRVRVNYEAAKRALRLPTVPAPVVSFYKDLEPGEEFSFEHGNGTVYHKTIPGYAFGRVGSHCIPDEPALTLVIAYGRK